MDIISHGLWGGIVLGKRSKKRFFQVFAISMLPDLLSLGLFWVFVFFGLQQMPRFIGTHLDYQSLPTWVHNIYTLTHSLVIFSIVYLFVWDRLKRPFEPLLAWGMHILIDIPSHSFIAFPTPFLWPISGYMVDGISWVDPIIMVPNIMLLLALNLSYFFYKRMLSVMSILAFQLNQDEEPEFEQA